MPRSGQATREKILDATQALVFDHGFSATSIDKVIDGAGITKGAFFYHFKTKADLGRAVVQRYADRDRALFDRTLERAERLAEDPLQQVLIFVGLLQEDARALTDPVPGCLFASYLYQPVENPDEVAEIAAGALLYWRVQLALKLREVMTLYAPKVETDPEELAGTLLAMIEGGYVLAKALADPTLVAQQLGAYRRTLELLFGEVPKSDA